MATLLKPGYKFRSDEAGSANHYDFHDCPFVLLAIEQVESEHVSEMSEVRPET
ncbi:MAG: hypothetical protein ABI197_07195 [Granulicella sp.]